MNSQIHIKIRRSSLDFINRDLARPHPFAHERLGILGAEFHYSSQTALLIPKIYTPLPDKMYIQSKTDKTILIGSQGIRFALSIAKTTGLSTFYVHLHSHQGMPSLSFYDRRHAHVMTDDLFNVNLAGPHGFLVTSLDSIGGALKLEKYEDIREVDVCSTLGEKLKIYTRNAHEQF